MDIRSIDLNVLLVFDAMFRLNHVSLAAKELRLSQPAVSYGLSKLRHILPDPLFVRGKKGMLPTDKALKLGPIIQAALTQMNAAIFRHEEFKPATSPGVIRISVDDYIAQIVLTPVLKMAAVAAPNVQFEILALKDRDPNSDLQKDLDFAIRAIPNVNKNLYSQRLASETFKVLVSRDHSTIKKNLTLKAFIQHDHILVAPFGGFDGLVDRELSRLGLKRHVRFSVAHFSLGPWILKNSPYLLTLPASLAEQYAKEFQFQVHEPPIEIPGFKINLYWHERVHKSPLHQWFRNCIKQPDRN